MKLIKYFAIIALIAITFGNGYSEYYYYSDDRQISIDIDSNQILILFNSGWGYNAASFAADYPRIDSIRDLSIFDQFRITYINDADSLDHFIDTLLEDYRVDLANPYFLNSADSSKLIGRTICCKFGENVSMAYINSLNAANGVEIEYENDYTDNLFLLTVTDSSTLSTLEIANLYYELEASEFCHPNFFGGYEWNSYEIYDYYWEEQWAMHRVFEVSPDSPESLNHKALEITQGDSNIIIAVVDQGMNIHEDLPNERLVAGYDFAGMDNDPCPCGIPGLGFHGESVAGIIGAEHNRNPDSLGNPNSGVYGIAPLCKLMPVKIGTGLPTTCENINPDYYDVCLENCVGGFFAPEEHMAAGIEWAWAHGADIISCSWGGREPSDRIEFAISQATIVGRDGKGCGIFFSSGNTPGIEEYYPAMYPEVISVASLHPDDSVWGYCTTAKVDVVAPSGTSIEHSIWTLDLMDENDSTGYNTYYIDLGCGEPDDDDYMCKFGGTSAAAPMAAGVAALVLSRRPELTHDELHDLIRNSADPYLYEEITDPPHQKYGHGMVHPLRALLSVSRGDANNDGVIDLLDVTYIFAYLYQGGPAPQPDVLMGDANCGCTGSACINILDITYIIDYLYNNGPPPPICFNYND